MTTIIAILTAIIFAIFPSSHITEDDPRWDCATMGNRICGTAPATVPFEQRYPDEAGQDSSLDTFEFEGSDGNLHESCTFEDDAPLGHTTCTDGYSEDS